MARLAAGAKSTAVRVLVCFCVLACVALQPPLARATSPAPIGSAPANSAASTPVGSASEQPRKVLRVLMDSAETAFDPSRVNDVYSRAILAHIFESLVEYDYLARPAKLRPLLADGMPVASDNFKTWVFKIKRGVYFADDPAFNGQKREVTAQDFVYTIQRFADPANKSPNWGNTEGVGILGLKEKNRAAVSGKKPYDYDQPLEGLQALDRYTFQVKLAQPRPRFIEGMARPDEVGVVAREVVERYGDTIGEHPVGTGPFRLKDWRRSSRIVLERNPTYRDVFYDAEPAADDADGQAILARFKGRKLPMVDEVDVSIISEAQPRWLSFLNHQVDAVAGLSGGMPGEFANQGLPKGKVAPNLAKRGIQGKAQVVADSTLMLYNLEDPTIGGYTPDKIALRRALNLAYDVDSEIRLVRRGLGVPAQSPIVPHTTGYDPKFKSEMSEFNPAKARALLDMYGYVDKDGDGWRDMPDGSPLTLLRGTQPELIYREFNELYSKDMKRIGVRVIYDTAQWAEHLKQARAGKLQLWMLGSTGTAPDGQVALQRVHGPQAGGQNLSRFKLPAFDALYDKLSELPDGPEREEVFRQAKLLIVAYAPYKYGAHRIRNDMWHPWFLGYKRPLFWQDWWHRIDIDTAMRDKMVR
jgi:ABC-type transport system substrate-binding protein